MKLQRQLNPRNKLQRQNKTKYFRMKKKLYKLKLSMNFQQKKNKESLLAWILSIGILRKRDIHWYPPRHTSHYIRCKCKADRNPYKCFTFENQEKNLIINRFTSFCHFNLWKICIYFFNKYNVSIRTLDFLSWNSWLVKPSAPPRLGSLTNTAKRKMHKKPY